MEAVTHFRWIDARSAEVGDLFGPACAVPVAVLVSAAGVRSPVEREVQPSPRRLSAHQSHQADHRGRREQRKAAAGTTQATAATTSATETQYRPRDSRTRRVRSLNPSAAGTANIPVSPTFRTTATNPGTVQSVDRHARYTITHADLDGPLALPRRNAVPGAAARTARATSRGRRCSARSRGRRANRSSRTPQHR